MGRWDHRSGSIPCSCVRFPSFQPLCLREILVSKIVVNMQNNVKRLEVCKAIRVAKGSKSSCYFNFQCFCINILTVAGGNCLAYTADDNNCIYVVETSSFKNYCSFFSPLRYLQ